jgi:hypothetical protein
MTNTPTNKFRAKGQLCAPNCVLSPLPPCLAAAANYFRVMTTLTHRDNSLLAKYLDPQLALPQVAEAAGFTIEELLLWLETPEIAEILSKFQGACATRAALIAGNVAPAALQSLDRVLTQTQNPVELRRTATQLLRATKPDRRRPPAGQSRSDQHRQRNHEQSEQDPGPIADIFSRDLSLAPVSADRHQRRHSGKTDHRQTEQDAPAPRQCIPTVGPADQPGANLASGSPHDADAHHHAPQCDYAQDLHNYITPPAPLQPSAEPIIKLQSWTPDQTRTHILDLITRAGRAELPRAG